MRRYIFILLFFLVLITPFVVRLVMGRTDDRSAAPVRPGEAHELVIVTPHTQDIRRAFAAAFSDWHQERFGQRVRITYLNPGGTNDIVRLIADKYGTDKMRTADGQLRPEAEIARFADIDMVWGGGDVIFEGELKPHLKPIDIPADVFQAAFPRPDLNGVPLHEPVSGGAGPRWVGVVLSSFGIIYNPSLYDTLGLSPPQTWDDLARPELSGLVALADPTRSGSAAVTYMMAVQRAMADAEEAFFKAHPELKALPPKELQSNAEYQAALARGWKRGMGTLLLMAANARYFTDSASQVPNDVGNGDAAAGVAIDFYARVFQQEIGAHRLRYIAPRGATAITPDPIAILYGVIDTPDRPRNMIANRFVEFLLSPEGQRLWNLDAGHSPYIQRSLRRMPIRPDVYADRTGWADDTNPFEEAEGFNMRGEWMGLFRDTRPIWAAAWIDSQSALKESYKTILQVRDTARRDQLLSELANLPIEMSDVDRQRRTRGEMAKRNEDVRLGMTRQRIEWADRFRAHYRIVADKAKQESAMTKAAE